MVEWINSLLGVAETTDITLAIGGFAIVILLVKTVDILCGAFSSLINLKN